MNAEYVIHHRRPLLISHDSLHDLHKIMDFAQRSTIDRIADKLGIHREQIQSVIEGNSEDISPLDRKIIDEYDEAAFASYSVGFASGYRPTKTSIDDILDVINSEPDEPAEFEVRLGPSYSGYFSVRIGSSYSGTASLRVIGGDNHADQITKRLRNWLKLNEPDHVWMRLPTFRVLLPVCMAVLTAALIIMLFRDQIFGWNAESLKIQILAVTTSITTTGIGILSYIVMKKYWPDVEFEIGWSKRRSAARRGIIITVASLFIVPIVLHFVRLT